MRNGQILRPVALMVLFCIPVIGRTPALEGAYAVRDRDYVRSVQTALPMPHERHHDLPMPEFILKARTVSPAGVWRLGPYESIQVNVNAQGDNIVGDAANEPSIAIDPTNPSRMAIGWRQFDSVLSDFREAGWAYSHTGGQTWAFSGSLEDGVFRSDPVLESDADGNFYFHSLRVPEGNFLCDMFKSVDGGATWSERVYAFGGDKQWFTIDKTDGPSRGFIYTEWSINAACCGANIFNRSTDGGVSFSGPVPIDRSPRWGTLTVGPDGEVYVVGQPGISPTITHFVARSNNAGDPVQSPSFDQVVGVNLGGTTAFGTGPNPGGLLGQVWIDTDHTQGPNRGNVYVLGSVDPPGEDPLDVMFIRSTDGGLTFSEPVRINDDTPGNDAWQWFGTMSVAPNGRIDVIWNDTRADISARFSELYYASSTDGGLTWSENTLVSPSFNHSLGYPSQYKLGDYYDMESDNLGASIAYAATFNGEQDVYFLRIGQFDCNGNGVPDGFDIVTGFSSDCNDNRLPDECELDCNDNGLADECDVEAGSPDCDGNLMPDECQQDFDGDGDIDECDLDIDGDGVPDFDLSDRCPFTPLGTPVDVHGRPIGDTDTSCRIDLGDVARLVNCLTVGGPSVPASRGCTIPFDYDADGYVDLLDAAHFQDFFEPR